MKVEVTICKHDLATGKIDGKIYSVEGKGKKCFDKILDEALQNCGITRETSGYVRNIEDEDGGGLGYTYYFTATDTIEYRITLIGTKSLWDHSFSGMEEDEGFF
jgi:hypothetical protein